MSEASAHDPACFAVCTFAPFAVRVEQLRVNQRVGMLGLVDNHRDAMRVAARFQQAA